MQEGAGQKRKSSLSSPTRCKPRQPTEGKGWAGFTEPMAVAAVVLRHHVPGDECWALWENPNSQVYPPPPLSNNFRN